MIFNPHGKEKTMNPISWIAERVVTVIAQMIGGAVVNKAETEALKNHINTLSELEAEAKRHEEAGNPLLAQVLRDNSQRMSARTDFTSLEFTTSEPKKPAANEQPVKNISNGQPGKKKRGRPRKSETTTPTENQTQSPHSNNEASQ